MICKKSDVSGKPGGARAPKPNSIGPKVSAYEEGERQSGLHDLGSAEQYEIHPQTSRLYEHEGLLARPGAKAIRASIRMKIWSGWKFSLTLTREGGVNLGGVEVILNMREKMEAMQKQIQRFVETLNQELSRRAARRPNASNSLMPVIQINSLSQDARRPTEGKRKAR